MIPILNFNFPETINMIIGNGNTNLAVVKEQPIENNQFINITVLAVQHGDSEGTDDAIVGSKEVFTRDEEGNKVLVATSVVLGSTTHPYGVEVFSDGKVILNVKQYATTENAQEDETLAVGESYKCNGFIMYKQ